MSTQTHIFSCRGTVDIPFVGQCSFGPKSLTERKFMEARLHPNLYSSLPLCANVSYYNDLAPQYPRSLKRRIVRELLTHSVHRILAGAGVLALLGSLIPEIISRWVVEGPGALSPDQLQHWYIWQSATHQPRVFWSATALILAILGLLEIFGRMEERDKRSERVALAQREVGIKLASGYQVYLNNILTKVDALPLLLRRSDLGGGQTSLHEIILPKPLRLVQMEA